jgi:UDP-N-acetylglucosamine 1-carboxyvinyltransferase
MCGNKKVYAAYYGIMTDISRVLGGRVLDSYVIQGGAKLSGSVKIEGAKNSILLILIASIISGSKNIFYNCPYLKDVKLTLKILEIMGASVEWVDDKLIVDTSAIQETQIPEELVREMRSSVIIMGAMLAKMGKVVLSYPGGCEIGARPIDLHIKGLRDLGAKIVETGGYLYCEAENMIGTEINLDFPSVGATENVMLAAVSADGTTIIRNAAREPEIIDLQNYLNSIGCKVSGAGTNIIKIEGVKQFHSTEFSIMPDRIVAGTYLCAAAVTHSNIQITDVIPEHLSAIISKLKEAGCRIGVGKNVIEIVSPKRIKAVSTLRTHPYPGFPTDLQAPFMAVLTTANGTSLVNENIFENRFKHASQLVRMGAKITIEGRTAIVQGVKKLHGTNVQAQDLRGGAALVIAALAAEGETTISGIHHTDRGYDGFEDKLSLLGADIKRISKGE